MPYAAVLPYINHQEPPVLQNPERVVRMSECERFERSFQPNVALAPRSKGPNCNITNGVSSKERDSTRLVSPEIQIKQERPATPIEDSPSPELRVSSPIKQSPPISPEGHSGSNEITSSTSPVPAQPHHNAHETAIHSPITTKPIEIHHIRTQQSPVSVLTNGCVPNVGNSEFELSTDTDDDSLIGEPDSSNNSASWDIAVEALKDTRPQDRDKVLQLIKMLVNENTQYSHENAKLVEEIRRKDDQIAELINHQQRHHQSNNNNHQHLAIRPMEATAIVVKTEAGSASIEAERIQHNNHHLHHHKPSLAETTETEVIRMPLKKSVRRSPESASVVVMQSSQKLRDEDRTKIDGITRLENAISNGKMLELVQTADG